MPCGCLIRWSNLVQHVAAHAEAFERELRFGLVEQTQHRALAVRRGQRRDAHVDGAAADAQRDAAVLRQPALGDVELGHDLQARDQRRVQRAVRLHHLAQRAVDAKAHRARALVGLDVDVAGAVLRRLGQQGVEHADDRRVVARPRAGPRSPAAPASSATGRPRSRPRRRRPRRSTRRRRRRRRCGRPGSRPTRARSCRRRRWRSTSESAGRATVSGAQRTRRAPSSSSSRVCALA